MTLLSSHCLAAAKFSHQPLPVFACCFFLSLCYSIVIFFYHMPRFSPVRTFIDVLNFKLIDFDSVFIARSFNFSLQGPIGPSTIVLCQFFSIILFHLGSNSLS